RAPAQRRLRHPAGPGFHPRGQGRRVCPCDPRARRPGRQLGGPMILCVGTTPVMQRSMVFDALHVDEVNRAVETDEYASGKSINAGKVVHRLGVKVLASGFLGGENGRFIRSDLDSLGVAQNFVEVEPRTRMCITLIDRGSGQVTELVEEARPVEAASWETLK